MTNKVVDLEKLIAQMFPWSLFDYADAPVAIRAYAQGFKDGYAKDASNVTIQVVQGVTAHDVLMEQFLKGENNAAQQEGTQDKTSDGKVLRQGEGR